MGEEEDEEEEVVVVVAALKASERSWVFMRTCSTMSSSVLGRPDQHSSAAAIGITSHNETFQHFLSTPT